MEPQVNKMTVGELFRGFFEYYASFDYKLNVVCPYLGRPVPRASFEKDSVDGMDRYNQNVKQPGIENLDVKITRAVVVQVCLSYRRFN